MKAIQFDRYGGPEVLQLVEVEEPHAPAGAIRIKVRAVGINGIDWKIRSGDMREMIELSLPAGTGIDAAGMVDEIGEGAADVQVGDAVFGSGSDTAAQYAVLTEWAAMPHGMSFDEAAGYGVSVETAIRILDQVGIVAGQTLLVNGASGGVGSAVVQIARSRQIHVIGTASDANHQYLETLGAVPVAYGDGLVQRVRVVAPNGVDAACDISGSGVIPELIELVGEPSKVLSIADFSAPAHGAQVSAEPVNRADALGEAARMFAGGKFHLPVAATYALADIAQAHRDSASGHVAGRRVGTVPQ